MQIKQVHAHFLISIGDYSNERIGFTVELDEGETAEEAVDALRKRAIAIVGPQADKLYNAKWEAQEACRKIEERLEKLRKEWNATAEFLRCQGLNPNAPSMPQFNNLLAAVNVEEEAEVVEVQF